MKCLHVAAALYFYNDTDIVIKKRLLSLSSVEAKVFFAALFNEDFEVFEKRGHRAKLPDFIC